MKYKRRRVKFVRPTKDDRAKADRKILERFHELTMMTANGYAKKSEILEYLDLKKRLEGSHESP